MNLAYRKRDTPQSLLAARQVLAFGAALCAGIVDSYGGVSSYCPSEFGSESRFDGRRMLMREK